MQATKPFTEFDLDPALLEGLSKMGYTHPTPVQEQAIPAVATGKDLMVQARTGTGKTLAFGLPTLHRIDPASPDTQILVICPTRELAVQVADELARVAEPLQIIVAAVFGGVKLIDQIDQMQWAPIVVGTPGRLRDHIERGYLHLDTCKVVVLDEADEMLDMGFKDDLEFILGKVKKEQRQTLLFSATFPPEIEKIANKYMRNPEKIQVSSGYTPATNLSHKFARVPKDKKIQALSTLMRQDNVTSGIIFCDTKVETAWVYQRLKREGFSIGMITGDVPQEVRLKTLQAFRDGELNLLVATDVAARGLDIPAVSHVYHFTVPRDTATYIHRSGRTARAGKAGVAFTLVTPEEERDFQRIMRDIKQGQPGGAPAPAAGGREGAREGGREGRREQPARGERGERVERGDRPERGERTERGPRPERGGERDRGERMERGERTERFDRGERVERTERPERTERSERGDRNGRDRGERNGRDRGGRDRGRGRFDRYAPEPLPQAPVQDDVGRVIERLASLESDECLSLAEYLLGRPDAVHLLGALLARNPESVSALERAMGEPHEEEAPAARAPEARGGEGDERNGRRRRSRGRGRGRGRDAGEPVVLGVVAEDEDEADEAVYEAPAPEPTPAPAPTRTRRTTAKAPAAAAPAVTEEAPVEEAPAKPTRTRKAAPKKAAEPVVEEAPAEEAPKKATRTRKTAAAAAATPEEAPAPKTSTRKTAAKKAAEPAPAEEEAPKKATRARKTTTTTTKKKAAAE